MKANEPSKVEPLFVPQFAVLPAICPSCMQYYLPYAPVACSITCHMPQLHAVLPAICPSCMQYYLPYMPQLHAVLPAICPSCMQYYLPYAPIACSITCHMPQLHAVLPAICRSEETQCPLVHSPVRRDT